MERKHFIRSIMGISAIGTLGSLQKISDNLAEQDEKMPVLFMGHGSPMNAIEDNEFSRRWKAMGDSISRPKAVLCISAHWLTNGTHITAMEKPRTIHDFGGFPRELFEAQYPAPGNPQLAEETKALISKTPVQLDHDWGLDHGAWSVIKQMYPGADIPVLQLSIDYGKPAQYHYELGKELAALRKKGVLVLGSGNMVHNLGRIGVPPGATPGIEGLGLEYGYDWAIEMNTIFKQKITNGDHKALVNYQQLSKSATLAVPTPDHYYPLLYTLALQEPNESLSFFNDKAVAGSITMTSVKIG